MIIGGKPAMGDEYTYFRYRIVWKLEKVARVDKFLRLKYIENTLTEHSSTRADK